MEVQATLKNASISAQKARLVADLIRNLPADEAINILKFTPKKGAELIKKLLESAVNNAENNQGIDIDMLQVRTIYVDEASSQKRLMPRAKGRGNRIVKRKSHITVKLSVNEE